MLTFFRFPCIIVLSIIVLILSVSVPGAEFGEERCVGTESTKFQPRTAQTNRVLLEFLLFLKGGHEDDEKNP